MRNIQLIDEPKAVFKATFVKTTLLLTCFFTLPFLSVSTFAETSSIPSKGMLQNQVKATFGEPINIKAPVGKPPIERWDYADYSVYFEGKYVIHSFHHNQRKQAILAPKINPTPAAEEEMAKEESLIETNSTDKLPVKDASINKVEMLAEEPNEEIKADSIEEPKVEEVAQKEPEEESPKDLNFEEPETKAEFGKWGY